MRRAKHILAAVVATGVAAFGAAAATAAGHPAPGQPGDAARWTTGAKVGVGTSASVASNVWYTLAGGVMTELYYPTVDVAASRALELVVTDGRTFSDRESTHTTHEVELPAGAGLAYRQVNTDADGRYRITKTYVTDPQRASVLVRVKFESLDGGRYAVYALYDPALANSGMHDSARTQDGALVAEDVGGAVEAASALVAGSPFPATSNGYAGRASDGWVDLRDDHDLDGRYGTAADGNVVQTAELPLRGRSSQVVLAIGFGSSAGEALATARASLAQPFGRTQGAYVSGWSRYLDSIDEPPASVRADPALLQQYEVALMQLKAHEDKLYRGANIASLTVPWGQAVDADEAGVGGYHLVWARDLYQVATAQLAAGDEAAANRSLDYLFEVQQKPDGSFPQNSLLDGTPYWGSLQLDEVAFPVVLAWQLGRSDAATYRDHVKPAADFIVANGPASPQERWEEESGYSPSTIAAQIAGLVTAAAIAARNDDPASAALYRGVADHWQRRVDGWTFTTTGPHGDGAYYERIDGSGDPDDAARVEINNGGGTWEEREIVDSGFLELVRLGVKRPDDPRVLDSLPELDATTRVETPHGAMWYRYNHDGYGEKDGGAPYDGSGVGRLWPLLTGERGEFELASGRAATAHLRTMAGAANDGLMIPEQVWDRDDQPGSGFTFGEGTDSATPLAWSMAQFVRLALSIDAGRPVETPGVVAERYTRNAALPAPALRVTAPSSGTTTASGTLTVTGTTDAEAVYVNAGGTTVQVAVADGTFSYDAPLSLGRNTITVVAVGAEGGTETVQIPVTSTNFGRALGSFSDPAGDDDGPGTYVYPTNGAFNDGAYDMTAFAVHDDGRAYNFVTTIGGEVLNPWGGNQISVQRLNFYVRATGGSGPVPALPGTNAQLAAPYDRVITGDGFNDLGVQDAAGARVGGATLLALPGTRQIVVSVPKGAFGDLDLASAQFAVVMVSHGGDGEGVGHVRPVYSRTYWESTAGTDMWWIREYRLGGGAGVFDGSIESRDTDTRDPNVVDVLVPEGQAQSAVLDWTYGSPVTLPYVTLR